MQHLSGIDVSEKTGESIEEGKRSGRPQTSRTAENIEQISAAVRSESDSSLTINESESSDDGSVLLRVMLAFLSHALKFISREEIINFLILYISAIKFSFKA
ncbi:hypothetical protein TNCV_4916871 [Trichonephila clavipes]|nr:hypothetical protein TNCV_4916871 [Trichonephila clavipes]